MYYLSVGVKNSGYICKSWEVVFLGRFVIYVKGKDDFWRFLCNIELEDWII